jgi:hypothetical protein
MANTAWKASMIVTGTRYYAETRVLDDNQRGRRVCLRPNNNLLRCCEINVK